MQELEDMRVRYDALKADNSTLLLERKSESASSPADRIAADANGNAGAADAHSSLPQGIAELQVCPALNVSLVLGPVLLAGRSLMRIMAA